jgi:broad specificity phosphatase PhoE
VYTDFLREKAQGSREGKRNDLTLEDAERIDAEAGIDVSSKFRESDEDVKARILSFLSNLIEGQDGVGGEEGGKEGESSEVPTDDAKPDGLPPNILVVTHGGVIRVLLRDIFKVGGGPGEER